LSYNFMTHKTNGIAQLFQKTKNKFNHVKLYTASLIRSLKTTCDKLRLKFKFDWWCHPLPIPPIFFSSASDDLQKWLL